MKESFGEDIQQGFSLFDEQPIASASPTQVHFAVPTNGTEVAVKIQCHHIQEIVSRDMVTLA